MAARRKELSQRRKAVGFTQESLAAQLGVERSTVIRWEAGDSEPLPSIRPNLACALQLSIEQLAELLTNSEIATSTARTVPADSEVHPPGHPDGAVIRPEIAETVEALRRALRSAGVSAEDLAAMLLVGGSPQVPLGAPGLGASDQPRSEALNPPSPRGARSGRRKRLVAVGAFALALPAVWLSAPFMATQSVATPQAASQDHAIVVGAIPAPNSGAGHDGSVHSTDSTGALPAAPFAVPDTPAAGPAQPAADTVPASHTARVPSTSRIASPAASRDHPPLSATQAWRIATAEAGHPWDGVDQIDQADHLR